MTTQAIAPRVRSVENMVARAIAKSASTPGPPACKTCHVKAWFSAFFDGTNNHRSRDFPHRHSNVVALFDAHRMDDDRGCRAVYYEGCGTEFNFPGRIQRTARVVGRDRKLIWTDKVGYDEEESRLNQMFGLGIDLRLEKAIFDFELFLDGLRKKSRVDEINVSAFGFSRGAATARAFTHWLRAHSKVTEAAGRLKFDGVPLNFKFLGLFDTVESIGRAGGNTKAELFPSAIPRWVEKCVHTVAAHELRDAFPVTIIDATAPSGQRVQVVSPGAHSDVGGGYEEGKQGRTRDLARINLLQMLDHARGAGLPMLSVAEMRAEDGGRWRDLFSHSFALDGAAHDTFRAYMRHVETPRGAMGDVLHAHMKWYWRWIDSGLAAEDTGQKFRRYWQAEPDAPGSAERRRELAAMNSVFGQSARTEAGRGRGAMTGHPVVPVQRNAIPAPVEALFENHVHDSQVGFRLVGTLQLDFSRIDYYAIRETRAPTAGGVVSRVQSVVNASPG